METREFSFLLGGALTVGLGVALATGLWWAGAGWEYFPAWFSAGMAVGLGVFFLQVGRWQRRDSRELAASGDPPARIS